MEQAIKTLKRRLVDLSLLERESQATAKKIKQAASDRLDIVNSNLDKLRPRTIQNQEAANRYQALVNERGRLHIVLGK